MTKTGSQAFAPAEIAVFNRLVQDFHNEVIPKKQDPAGVRGPVLI